MALSITDQLVAQFGGGLGTGSITDKSRRLAALLPVDQSQSTSDRALLSLRNETGVQNLSFADTCISLYVPHPVLFLLDAY